MIQRCNTAGRVTSRRRIIWRSVVALAVIGGIGLVVQIAVAADAPPEGGKTAPGKVARVVCFGDSITAKGYPQAMAKLMGDTIAEKGGKKSARLEIVNAGVGGETTAAALKRLDKDVLARKPDVVVILFGTNDSRLAEPAVCVPVAAYEANLSKMARQCQSAGAKVVFCTIPPIDASAYFHRHARAPFDKAGGFEKVLNDYRSATARAAQAANAPLVDLGQRLADQPGWLSADGVHPTDEGNRIIARIVADTVAPMLGATAGSSTDKSDPRMRANQHE